VIRLGIDLESRVHDDPAVREEHRRLFGIPADRFVVGWIGRMTAIKRVPDVLTSFKALLDLGVDATLCLVGDGPDRETAEQQAKDLGIARHVLSVGYQRDVSPYYALFDALVLPSANEGTPVVAIEALAARRPVVATRVGGVPDVVVEGEDGFLVEVGDIDGIANALATLARDPELRRRMGEHGRERVLPRYRVERLVDDTDELYRELLSQKGLPLPPSS
jgi:L-malate glycosyltransferase